MSTSSDNTRVRAPSIRVGNLVDDLDKLERRPAVCVYSENDGIVRTVMVPYFVFMSGTDIRNEAKLIRDGHRKEKFKYIKHCKVTFKPYYLHLVGSKDPDNWTLEEARVNVEGYIRLKAKEDDLIVEHDPERNKRRGGGGDTPHWVTNCCRRLGYSTLGEFEAVR